MLMKKNNYQPVIGLEVHVELKTKTKMFCGCLADYFGEKPNTHVCPVCLGLPGALPVPNKLAIEWCMMLGLALECEIQNFSKFDRKNYFYADLPKGYQISQYDLPFCRDGKITLSGGKVIRIRRVHMEEDTAKLVHEFGTQNYSLIDFNRSGVPLVEIVTEPDFGGTSEVVEYLRKLQQIVRYLDVSNADMEKGDMRLEPNISLRELKANSEKRKTQLPDYKVEVKNINSFRFVEKAVEYEIKRQTELLEEDEKPVQETRGWDERKQVTVAQRVKEEAQDYRYFPEPDVPPFTNVQLIIDNLKLPELPDQKKSRFMEQYGLTDYQAFQLIETRAKADFYEEAVKDGKKYSVHSNEIANVIINRRISWEEMLPAELIQTILKGRKAGAKSEEVEKAVKKVTRENKKAVEDYRKGKTQILGFLIGQVIKLVPEATPQQAKVALEKELS